MQLSMFEDVTIKQKGIMYVVENITISDTVRDSIIKAVTEKDRGKLIRLFKESIKTYGFSDGDYSWFGGRLIDRSIDLEFEVTARELADASLNLKIN